MKKRTPITGRKSISRSLPALTEICAGFNGFKGAENRADRVFELLSTAIQRCRRAKPQPFYAMREMGEFFGVSLNTIFRVYSRLGREGLLTLVRGSQSIIPARAPRLRFAVRGVVCLPIWLPGFLQFVDWRRWFSQLEEELTRHRFVLEPIFYTNEKSELLVERMLKFNPDYLIWNSPVRSNLSTLHSMADTGVSIVVIQNLPGHYPGRIYHHSFERGLRQGLKAWEADGGIDQIIVPEVNYGDSHPSPSAIKSALRDCALPHRFFGYQGNEPFALDSLKRLKLHPRTGIVFDDPVLYFHFCNLKPAEMFEIFRKHRVMVMSRVTMPLSFEIPAGMTVDALLFPWQRLARRIASDLNKGKGMLPSEDPVFEAEWLPRTALSEITQRNLSE